MDIGMDSATGRLVIFNTPLETVTSSQVITLVVQNYNNLLNLAVTANTLVYVLESQGEGLPVNQGGTFRPGGLYIFKDNIWETSLDDTQALVAYSTNQVVATTVAYAITLSDDFIECTSGTFNISLPSALDLKGKIFNITNTGTGVITLTPTGAETIQGDLSQEIYEDESFTLISNGNNWLVI
jgi:ABC-type uncharacterized transport system permease subunit